MPTTNHFITLNAAKEMTGNYRNNNETILGDDYKNKEILPICETFDRSAFDAVLAQTGCVGIRIYMGMDQDLLVKVVVVGVDENDEDILVNNDEKILDMGHRCPRWCPPSSPLNS